MTEITNKTLNLYKLWQICNKLSNKQDELAEKNIFVSLMGVRSNYCDTSFEHFLEYYSFRFEESYILVFNDDGIPYEIYNNDDFSYVPTELIDMSDEGLDLWIEVEVERQLEAQRVNKLAEKENIKLQIERLQKQLEL